MSNKKALLALDVGEVRIGIAVADTAVRIAIPFITLSVDGDEVKQIARIVLDQAINTIVVGYPRNQSGETTAQTEYVETFSAGLSDLGPDIVFQDESLTSVIAEQRLKDRGTSYQKSDIDMEAAVLILQDYMEQKL